MEQKVRAFVGHSFEEKDKEVVNTFIEFFEGLKIGMSFDWDHAKRTETKAISDKVKEIMEGKNLFIGIFTERDYRILKDNIKEENGGKVYISKDDLEIGISDWIVQESGYALGKKMRLLFLVEEGIERPHGLQADLECIPFNRENPSLSFLSIVESIGNLIKEAQGDEAGKGLTAIPAEIKSQQLDQRDIELEEKETHKEDIEKENFITYYSALSKSIVDEKNLSKATEELKGIITKFKGDKHFDEIFWKIRFFDLKILAGYSESFEELQKLADENQDDMRPRKSLASNYKQYKSYTEAANQYQIIIIKETDNNKRIDYIIEIAECYSNDKNFTEAKNIILKEFNNDHYNKFQLDRLYKELALLSKVEGNSNHFISFAEKTLDSSPADENLRFILAYHLNEIEMYNLAFYHYKILCSENPSAGSYNNIGLIYDHFEMKGKAVNSFRRAIEGYKETYAVANIAKKYINEGFYDEAQAILAKAKEQEDYSESIDRYLSDIKNKIQDEDKMEKDKAESVIQERKFIINYAEAYTRPKQINLDGEWDSEHGKINLIREGIIVTGHFEVPPTAPLATTLGQGLGLRNALLGLGSDGKIIKLEGKINNRAIEYSLNIKRTSYTETLLTSIASTTEYEGLMYIDDDSKVIKIMERKKEEKIWKFYEMKRQDD